MYKTILAPNAPWYPIVKGVVKKHNHLAPPKRTHRAKPSEIDRKFEEWLNSLEKIK